MFRCNAEESRYSKNLGTFINCQELLLL